MIDNGGFPTSPIFQKKWLNIRHYDEKKHFLLKTDKSLGLVQVAIPGKAKERKEVNDIPFEHFNPNPTGTLLKDCGVRTLSILLACNYTSLRKMIQLLMKTDKFATNRKGIPFWVVRKLLQTDGWEFDTSPNYGRGATLKSIVEKHPTCCVNVCESRRAKYGTHIFPIVDGIAYDNWNVVQSIQKGNSHIVDIAIPESEKKSERISKRAQKKFNLQLPESKEFISFNGTRFVFDGYL